MSAFYFLTLAIREAGEAPAPAVATSFPFPQGIPERGSTPDSLVLSIPLLGRPPPALCPFSSVFPSYPRTFWSIRTSLSKEVSGELLVVPSGIQPGGPHDTVHPDKTPPLQFRAWSSMSVRTGRGDREGKGNPLGARLPPWPWVSRVAQCPPAARGLRWLQAWIAGWGWWQGSNLLGSPPPFEYFKNTCILLLWCGS